MKPIVFKLLRIVAATLFALLLTVAAVLICAVRFLHSDRLAPLVCKIAEDNLNAKVEIDSLALAFEPAFPVLRVKTSGITIVSHALDMLPDSLRRGLPPYSDTLLTVERFSGAINVAKFLTNSTIELHNVEIVRPGVNIVVTPQMSNFDIYHSALDSVEGPITSLPAISIDRFAFVEPREMRFFNAADSTEASVVLLAHADLDGSDSPDYSVRLEGEFSGPMARTLLELDGFQFGVNGRLHWNPAHPQLLSVEKLRLRGAFVEAVVDAAVSMGQYLNIEHATVNVEHLRISDVLSLVPAPDLRKAGLDPAHFQTDAQAEIQVTLQQPYIVGVDSLPYANIKIEIPECGITSGAARFHNVSLAASAGIFGAETDRAIAVLDRFTIAGPATSLLVSGDCYPLRDDPSFNVSVSGRCNLANLPPKIAELARAYIAGKLDVKLNCSGAVSMFADGMYHNIAAEGTIKASDLYYLNNDTTNMVDIPSLNITFDSQHRIGSKVLLSAKVAADTVTMLFGGTGVDIGGVSLGIGALNEGRPADSTIVMPIGGGLKVRTLDVRSITDSAGMHLRGLNSYVALRRFNGDKHLPMISLHGEADRIAAGSPTTIFVLNKANIDASTHKLPYRAAAHKAFKATVDSLTRVHPHLSPDSVLRLAVERRRHRPKHKHVTTAYESEGELIEWHTSNSFRRFLLDWQLEGSVNTHRARLYTPFFPLRNSIRRLDLRFNTDTVELRNIEYRAGHSNLQINGLLSNVRRAFTSNARLKVNLSVQSDTVDVNEIAQGIFAGSAYAERRRKGHREADMHMHASDFDERLEALTDNKPDSVGPLLIPVNIDARVDLKAANILYSDLKLNHMGGQILVYDGAVNINNLHARSDAGALELSALYSAAHPADMKFGFGMQLSDFKIEKFLNLVPAIDSIMPLMRDFSGVIDANMAATVDIDSAMNFVLPTLDAAVHLSGDSLAFVNPETYRKIGKWLRFRDKADNTIKHLSVELLVKDNRMELFPFTIDIDRYRLGVTGYNDLDLNFNYHIAVLKSPIPFKFGVTIKGNPDHYKVRLGGAKFNDAAVPRDLAVVDTARVNLVRQIQNVFRRGVANSNFANLHMPARPDLSPLKEAENEVLTPADSAQYIRNGLIEVPAPDSTTVLPTKKRKSK